ncbi:MAG: hypothetical protein OEZ34_01845, partial [Spirochaetia bacterium]|nr:hypothetical protein [Spirochaetia bacterium]
MKQEKETDRLLKENKYDILSGILGTRSPEQVESSMAFAGYMNHVGINNQNYMLFFYILSTNNKWIINSLLGDRDPSALFSIVKPEPHLIKKTFQNLARRHPEEIYYKALMSFMGILENTYYKPDDGFRIHPLDINDLNNMGKFLDKNKSS